MNPLNLFMSQVRAAGSFALCGFIAALILIGPGVVQTYKFENNYHEVAGNLKRCVFDRINLVTCNKSGVQW